MNGITTRVLILYAAIFVAGCRLSESRQNPQPIELRGIWLSNADVQSFESRENISGAMQFLADHNFNAVFPAVLNDGLWMTKSDRDPLGEMLEEAHKRNIAVIPWFDTGLSVQPGNRHLLAHPEWTVRDGEGNVLIKNGFQWMNAFHPEVQQFIFSAVMELVKNYNVDGIQGSDRMPAMPIEGGYDSLTQAVYADVHGGTAPPPDFREMHWKYWRAVRLNSFAQQIYWKVKALKPNAIVSWAVAPYPLSLDENLQDWRSWITLGVAGDNYADYVHPQIKAAGIEEYKLTLDSQKKEIIKINDPNRFMFPGIYLSHEHRSISVEDLKEALRYNRYNGYNGEVISSYAELRKEDGKFAKALLESYYKTPARLPFSAAFQK